MNDSVSDLVYHRERLVGVHLQLIEFFNWWERYGPFPIVIDPKGGVRTDAIAQKALFEAGRSKAKLLEDTPHGRGCAVDAWPAVVKKGRIIAIRNDESDPRDIQLLSIYGELAERHALIWGGRWKMRDYSHIETHDWRSVPFIKQGVTIA